MRQTIHATAYNARALDVDASDVCAWYGARMTQLRRSSSELVGDGVRSRAPARVCAPWTARWSDQHGLGMSEFEVLERLASEGDARAACRSSPTTCTSARARSRACRPPREATASSSARCAPTTAARSSPSSPTTAANATRPRARRTARCSSASWPSRNHGSTTGRLLAARRTATIFRLVILRSWRTSEIDLEAVAARRLVQEQLRQGEARRARRAVVEPHSSARGPATARPERATTARAPVLPYQLPVAITSTWDFSWQREVDRRAGVDEEIVDVGHARGQPTRCSPR